MSNKTIDIEESILEQNKALHEAAQNFVSALGDRFRAGGFDGQSMEITLIAIHFALIDLFGNAFSTAAFDCGDVLKEKIGGNPFAALSLFRDDVLHKMIQMAYESSLDVCKKAYSRMKEERLGGEGWQ